MPARRKLTMKQLKLLIDFAESHRDIAMGRTSGGPLVVQAIRQAWLTIASQLNAVADGVKKTPYQWRRYWIELKAKTKTKAADSRRHVVRGSGGPNKLVPLNEVEKRVLALVDPVAVKKLLDVWIPIEAKTEVPSPEPTVAEDQLDNTPAPEEVPITKVERPPSVENEEEEMHGEESEEMDEEEVSLAPPMVTTREQSHRQPNFLVYSGHPQQQATQRPKKQRQVRIDDSVPRWAYNLERRRIAAEERHATALEALVHILGDIRDHMRRMEPQ